MSSSKALCVLCVILFIGFTSVLAQGKSISTTPKQDEGPKGNCTCGGFPTMTPDPSSVPILSQCPGLTVTCNEEGQTTCKNLCNALAIATKAKGPEILCNKLENADELTLSAFSKICDKPWMYADVTASKALCCEKSKVKVCASAAKLNATEAVDDAKLKI